MKQKLLATLTFGATLLAGGGLALADETAEVAQSETKPAQATPKVEATQSDVTTST